MAARSGRRPVGWPVAAAAVALAVLVLATGVSGGALVFRGETTAPMTAPASRPADPSHGEVGTLGPLVAPDFTVGGQWCTLPYGVFTLGMLTAACQQFQNQFNQLSGTDRNAYLDNLAIATYNYLNETASVAAVMNATAQELISYFADRAEAVVPYFLNQSWNNRVYDEIATYSGLAQALQGLKSAVAEQEYQDWNATVASYQGRFSTGMEWASDGADLYATDPTDSTPSGNALVIYNEPYNSTIVTPPWEVWTGYHDVITGTGAASIYFALEPGGTVVDANINNDSATYWYGNWTVKDVTTGQTVAVPDISYAAWTNQTQASVPVLSKLYPFGPFDLMEATCNSGCSNGYSPYLETMGAYAFENTSSNQETDVNYVNSMVPHIFVGQRAIPSQGFAGYTVGFPGTTVGICFPFGGSRSGTCDRPSDGTGAVPSEGFATEISGGPGQVVGGNDTLTQFAGSLQRVLNNTMTLAHALYDVERAMTDNGTYAIPADCSIPTPSDAFPAATNPALYQLSLPNTEVVYLAYLESIDRFYGSTFANTIGFCDDPDLGIAFNWTQTWNLATNITASVYLGSPGGAVYLNGTNDSASRLSNPLSWPVRDISPTLLYPFEFQMDVPVGTPYPIPANDPIAGVLVNYSGNQLYGSSDFTPTWGVPTYANLAGEGNLVQVSGSLSSTRSGGLNYTGDAIDISSCVVGGHAQSTCDLSVTYFDNYTFGAIHAFVSVSCEAAGTCPGGGGGGGGGPPLPGSGCGFGVLNSWYDGWVGDIGVSVSNGIGALGAAGAGIPLIGHGWAEFWEGVGCVVAWIIVILIFVGLALLVVYIGRAVWRAWRG